MMIAVYSVKRHPCDDTLYMIVVVFSGCCVTQLLQSVILLFSAPPSLTPSLQQYPAHGSKPMSESYPHLLEQCTLSGETGGQKGDGNKHKNIDPRYKKRSALQRRRKQQQMESFTGKD